MAKYLDPKADLTFKKVFGEHKELLISFLNAMLPLPEGKTIESIEYMSPELVPANPEKKDTIVDVRCTDKDGRNFIVEMQMYWTDAFKKRVLLNTSKAYSLPVSKGQKYNELKPIYSLSLVNDIAFPELEDFYHVYEITNNKHHEYKLEDMVFVFIELPKFRPSSISEEKLRCLWLRFLTEINEHTKAIDADLLENKEVSKAIDLVEQSAYTDAELYTIDRYWDAVSRERTSLEEKYGLGFTNGEAHGHAEGLTEGLMEGKRLVAKNMKDKGMDFAVIADVTGLSLDEIKNA